MANLNALRATSHGNVVSPNGPPLPAAVSMGYAGAQYQPIRGVIGNATGGAQPNTPVGSAPPQQAPSTAHTIAGLNQASGPQPAPVSTPHIISIGNPTQPGTTVINGAGSVTAPNLNGLNQFNFL